MLPCRNRIVIAVHQRLPWLALPVWIYAIGSLLVASAAAQDTSSNLVAHWELDDASGTTAVDSTANGHDGTLVGNPTWQSTAKIGRALDVDDTVPVIIGAANVSGRPFDGVLDDVRIYKRVLCPEGIRGLYKGGRPGYAS